MFSIWVPGKSGIGLIVLPFDKEEPQTQPRTSGALRCLGPETLSAHHNGTAQYQEPSACSIFVSGRKSQTDPKIAPVTARSLSSPATEPISVRLPDRRHSCRTGHPRRGTGRESSIRRPRSRRTSGRYRRASDLRRVAELNVICELIRHNENLCQSYVDSGPVWKSHVLLTCHQLYG